ncbi:adenylate/guanylate cyclase domain-containing protein [Methylobacterium tarhaniae]|uniref:adenylate/guanylate cyclase domain-containing protein n=1 Tax=Methylobacterium tarhaniae TaxID=1187852 RepID=UPI00142E48E5|nr:adenylate/guanylate cyclase domain-containing protein [Methylobacterium tarhaniae]
MGHPAIMRGKMLTLSNRVLFPWFDNEDENSFLEYYAEETITSLKYALTATVALHLLLMISDWLAFREEFLILAYYHLYIIISCGMAVPMFSMPLMKKHLFVLVPIFWIPSAMAIAIVMYLVDKAFDAYICGVVFTLLYACCAVRLLFLSVVVCCLLQVAFINIALLAKSAGADAYTYTNFIMIYAVTIGLVLSFTIEFLARRNFILRTKLDSERAKLDAILRDILPASILSRIRSGERRIADLSSPVTILFADIVGFTKFTLEQRPEFVVDTLNDLFTQLDEIAARHGVEKIKTVGDAYMAAVGIGDAVEKDAASMAEFALDARDAVAMLGKHRGIELRLRFGIATGRVVSGVIGNSRPVFDTWGLQVNLASRLEGLAPPNGILLDKDTTDVISGRYEVSDNGLRDVKGIGHVPTYLLVGRGENSRSKFSIDD